MNETKILRNEDLYIDPRPYGEISFYIVDKLLCLIERGENPAQYLIDNEIQNIAIYGMGHLGRHFQELLRRGGINVLYALDQKAECMYDLPLDVYLPSGDIPKVDAIVVTPVKYLYKIEKELNELMPDTHIISAETLVDYQRV